jgi:hypothetical protein
MRRLGSEGERGPAPGASHLIVGAAVVQADDRSARVSIAAACAPMALETRARDGR